MNSREPTVQPASKSGPGRRIAAAVVLSLVVFVALWIMAFSLLTAALISAGCCVVAVAGSTVSDVVTTVLDIVATVIFGILAIIAAIVGAILGLSGA